MRGGDTYTELGGATQRVDFAKGNYINPGPWRIPYHHYAVLDYCKRLGVALEPFIQVNYNAMVHSTQAFEGKPQRYRAVQADFQGHVAELLSKAVNQHGLDQALTREDRERLLEVMRKWVPTTHEAFLEYRLGAETFSRTAVDLLRRMLAGETVDGLAAGLSPREWRELQATLGLPAKA